MLQAIVAVGGAILIWILVIMGATAVFAIVQMIWDTHKESAESYKAMERDALRARALERALIERIKQEKKDEQSE